MPDSDDDATRHAVTGGHAVTAPRRLLVRNSRSAPGQAEPSRLRLAMRGIIIGSGGIAWI